MPTQIISGLDFDSGLSGSGVGFGLSNVSAAAALRKLADAIETDRAQPERAVVSSRARSDDFHTTTLVLTYIEKAVG